MTSVMLAYIGPGTGLSAIGALLAVVAALAIALFGFVWFPLRRLLRRAKGKQREPVREDASVDTETSARQDGGEQAL